MPMDAARRKRRKLRREREIIEGARRIFAERGYEDTTVKDIADGLDISVGAVYIYFRDKDELYYAVIRDGLKIMTDMFAQAAKGEGSGLDRFSAVGMAYVRFWNEYPEYRRLLHGACPPIGPGGGRWGRECFALNNERMGLLVRKLMDGIRDGSIRGDIDPVSTAFCVAGSFHGVLSALEGLDGQAKKPGISEQGVMTALFNLFRTSLRSGKTAAGGKAQKTTGDK
jgi:TetR/AcrR family transcriptional regulator